MNTPIQPWSQVVAAHQQRTDAFAEPIQKVLQLIAASRPDTPPPNYIGIGCVAWTSNPEHTYDAFGPPNARQASDVRGGQINVIGPRAPWQWETAQNLQGAQNLPAPVLELHLSKFGPAGYSARVRVERDADVLEGVLLEFLDKLAEPDCAFGKPRLFVIEYEVEGIFGTRTAGPYPDCDVASHEQDIRGFEGVSNVQRRPA